MVSEPSDDLSGLAARTVGWLNRPTSTLSLANGALRAWRLRTEMTQSTRGRLLNQSSPLLSLSDDILLLIASFLTSDNRIRMSLVSQRIRCVLLADSTLWTDTARFAYSEPLTLLLLERSYPEVVRLRLIFSNSTSDHSLQRICSNMSRLASFHVDIFPVFVSNHLSDVLDPGLPTHIDWERLSELLQVAAPELAALSVYNYLAADMEILHPDPAYQPQSCHWTISSNLLAGEAGKLRSCRLHDVLLPLPLPPALRGLTTLEYQIPAFLTSAILDEILAWMPLLIRLSLSCKGFVNDGSLQAPRAHESLRGVVLYDVGESRWPILEYFDQQKLGYIHLPFRSTGALPTSGGVSEVTVCSPHTSIRRSGDVPAVLHFFIPWFHNQELLNTCLSTLTTVTVDEATWTSCTPFNCAAPSLHSLRIVLSGCIPGDVVTADCREDAPFGLLACGLETALECPRLRILEISAHSQTCEWLSFGLERLCICTRCRLSFFDIETFVRSSLKYEAQQLDMLRLHGIESIDWSPEAAWGTLDAIARRVDCLPLAAMRASRVWDNLDRSTYDFFQTLQDYVQRDLTANWL